MTRVLLVDDKGENRYLLRALLGGHGFDVDEAGSGDEALARARSEPPDVVVSDLLMPGMDGYTLLRHWKADTGLKRIPFVVFTATYTDPADEQLALDLGADAFLLKPMDPAPFLERLRAVLDQAVLEGQTEPRKPDAAPQVLLEEYNAVLVRKLEEKLIQLEDANQKLVTSEARLRAILDGEPECVKVVARDGTLVEMNPAGLAMIEADSFAQVEGCSILPLVVEEHRDAFRAFLEQGLHGETGTLEFEIVGLRGTRRWLETHGTPLRAPSGEITGILNITRDVTRPKQRETELRELRDRLQRAVSAGNVGLWDWDLRTNKVYFSPEWKSQIGYADDEIGDDFDEWQSRVHPDDLERVLATTRAFIDGDERSHEVEFRFRHKNGSHRRILARSSLLRDADGTPLRMLGTHVDISDYFELQAQFLQAQKMESVGQLAGGIAHDFNNLLTVIRGTVDLALPDLPEADPLRADLEQIQQATKRAATLTRQLLAFSRRQVLQPTVLNLGTVISDMEPMLRPLLSENIELASSVGVGLGNVRADVGQIEQAILNLVINARDAMPEGGTLTLEAENVVLDESYAREHPTVRPGPHVMLAIRDTGAGMDEATRQRIFEPFFTTKARGQGTGLGLSSTYGIIKQSGGSIWVYSEPGRGTTFRVYLPRVDDAAAVPRPGPDPVVVGGDETVLVVEDDEALRRLAARVLSEVGYTVLTAGDAEEALLRAEAHEGPLHLLLTDVVMPGPSGPELALQILANRPKTKVLYTSGYTGDPVVGDAIRDGFAAFIAKPYSPTELAREVRRALDG